MFSRIKESKANIHYTQCVSLTETGDSTATDMSSAFLDIVWKLCNFLDMPLSNTSVSWPVARHRKQGYNPSVKPSLTHMVLIQWGLVPTTVSKNTSFVKVLYYKEGSTFYVPCKVKSIFSEFKVKIKSDKVLSIHCNSFLNNLFKQQKMSKT